MPYTIDQLEDEVPPDKTPEEHSKWLKGCMTFTGMDLGIGKELTHDWSVLFTVMLQPDGKIRVLQIESGKWTSPEIIEKIRDTHYRYRSQILVESNQAQKYIVDFVKDKYSKIPIKPFNTGGGKAKLNNKHHPEYGVEGIANELANKDWIIPSTPDGKPLNQDTENWIRGMLYYDPRGHTSDWLIACWISREGARRRFRHLVSHVDVGHPLIAQNGLMSGENRDLSLVPIEERRRQIVLDSLQDLFQPR